MACRAFARLNFSINMSEMTFILENIQIHRPTLLSENAKTTFLVYIEKTTGAFVISESKMTVCTGIISTPSKNEKSYVTTSVEIKKESLTLNSKDFYKELTLRGYEYAPTFQGVIASDLNGYEGILKWNNNWIVYLDSMLQFSALKLNKRVTLVPTGIQKITIDPKEHMKIAEETEKEYEGVPLKHNPRTGEYFSGGVYIKNITAGFLRGKKDRQEPLLEEYKFIPYFEDNSLSTIEIETQENYIRNCSSVSQKILNIFGKRYEGFGEVNGADTNIPIDDYIETYTDNCVLLKCLLSVLDKLRNNEMTKDIKKYVDKYIEERPNDFLYKMLINEHHLRPLIDAAFENISSRKLKIAEVTEGNRAIISDIKQYISVPEMYQISWLILHPDTELVNQEQLPSNTRVEIWKNKPSLDFEGINLLILSYLNCSKKDLKSVLENAMMCLKNGGFIVLLQKTRLLLAEDVLTAVSEIPLHVIKEGDLELIFKDLNLNVIGKRSDLFTSTVYLLRKSTEMNFNDSVIHIAAEKYHTWVDTLKAKMKELKELQDSTVSPRVWIISEGYHNSGIVGLVNCLRQEPGGSYIRSMYIDKEASEIPNFSLNHSFYEEQVKKNLLMNVYHGGSWGSYRHIRCKKDLATIETEHAYLKVLTIGDLSSFAWIESPLKYFTSTKDAILCHVYYASLNFKDVMQASGKLPLLAHPGSLVLKDSVIGFEFSGRTYEGKRVMGIVSHKAMATTLTADPTLLLEVPDDWTLEEAATVPVAYGTAFYALIDKAKLDKEHKVLIHAGSGGVGQAAISIALHLGCEVFTSVGSEEKKEFLKKKFPQLKDRHFCSSRDTTFEQHILQETNGEGVDVVLNSLAEDKLFASLNCLACNGCFLEIGRLDMVKNSSLGMAVFLKNISIHGINLDAASGVNKSHLKMKFCLMEVLKQGLANGVIKPLNTTVFNYNDAEQAFRYMATGRHTGKVLLKIRDEEQEKQIVPTPVRVMAMKRTGFDSKKSYIILGGLGGFGLELCDWLIDRGAKNIILASRSGITTGYQQLCMQRWKEDSANVVITNLNASNLTEASSLIKLAAEYGPVGGIFNLAMVLKDGFMENQSVENFIEVCNAKVETTKNADLSSRELCPQLDWFVCFSSLSCGRGNPAQSNYGYANSIMERICEARVSEGFPGLAIQWGAVGDVGVVHETAGSDIVFRGTVPQRINSCLTVLDKFLQQGHPVVSSLVPHDTDESSKIAKGDILFQMASIFGIRDMASINPEATLGELGLDSLMGVELKQILEINLNIVMTVSEIRDLKVKDLKRLGEQGNLNVKARNIEIEDFNTPFFLAHFHVLDGDDLVSKETIIKLNKISDGLPLFVIHPMEGSALMLQSLAELLPCPVYGIQFTPQAPGDSIENLGAWYWKHIKSMKPQSICLAGYSFGATVAFEMAIQAEQEMKEYPEVKNLFLLDGSPKLLYVLAHRIISRSFGATLTIDEQTVVLFAFSKCFVQDIKLDKTIIKNLNGFEERLCYATEKIAEKLPKFEPQKLQILYNMFYKEVHMSHKYIPKHKLKAGSYLIKASEKLAATKSLSDLYDLEKVCEGNVTVRTITGTHTDFIQSDSVKDVANVLKEIMNL